MNGMRRDGMHHQDHVGSSVTPEALLLQSAALGARPDRQAERDLVDEVGQVVHQVQGVAVHGPAQVPEEVAEGVDGPTDRDDEPHGLEGGRNVLVHIAAGSRLAGLTREDLAQDVTPSAQAQDEADDRGAAREEQVVLAEVPYESSSDCFLTWGPQF